MGMESQYSTLLQPQLCQVPKASSHNSFLPFLSQSFPGLIPSGWLVFRQRVLGMHWAIYKSSSLIAHCTDLKTEGQRGKGFAHTSCCSCDPEGQIFLGHSEYITDICS